MGALCQQAREGAAHTLQAAGVLPVLISMVGMKTAAPQHAAAYALAALCEADSDICEFLYSSGAQEQFVPRGCANQHEQMGCGCWFMSLATSRRPWLCKGQLQRCVRSQYVRASRSVLWL